MLRSEDETRGGSIDQEPLPAQHVESEDAVGVGSEELGDDGRRRAGKNVECLAGDLEPCAATLDGEPTLARVEVVEVVDGWARRGELLGQVRDGRPGVEEEPECVPVQLAADAREAAHRFQAHDPASGRLVTAAAELESLHVEVEARIAQDVPAQKNVESAPHVLA
jgi:hypothetical protein